MWCGIYTGKYNNSEMVPRGYSRFYKVLAFFDAININAASEGVRTRPESIRDTGEMKKERSEMDTGAARSPKDTTKEENSI